MNLNRNARMFFALMKIRLTRRIADPVSFWTAFFVDTTVFGLQLAVFSVIYLNVQEINGWGRWETMFFVGTFTLIDGIYMATYFFGLLRLPDAIRTGTLDLFLAKPVDSLLRLSFDGADPGSLFLAIPAFGMLSAACVGLGLHVGPVQILSYAAAVSLMLLLMYDLMVLVRVSAFWTGRTTGMESLEGSLVEFGFRIPGRVWKGGLRVLFCVFLPYGLIATFPTEAFLGSADLAAWASALAVVAAFTFLARAAWKLGLRRYAGTGS